ncbi:MAG: hypothetical protein KQJ78_01350 [Deltaproteobacteria bacterium]|nr:hypothetical protein [Deltaproteobacteria bacterium]
MRLVHKLFLAWGICLASLALGCPAAQAGGGPLEGPWEFSVAPYGWLMGISDEVTVRGQRASVNVDFGDIWDALDFAGELHLEVMKGRLGLFLDPSYLKVSVENSLGPLNLDTTLEVTLFEYGAFYRVYRTSLAGPGREFAVDVLAGGRYWDLNVDIGLPRRTVSGDQSWTDPFVGARLAFSLTENWLFRLRGDVGGFGVGSDSAWQAIALVEYRLANWAGVVVGYRALYTDYADGSGRDENAFDATIHGPVVGVNFWF